MDIFIEKLDILNEDVLDIIFSFIPIESKIFLNKTYYNKYHHRVKDFIDKKDYLKYLEDMVKHNCTFVLTKIFDEEFHNWKTKITKNKKVYPNLGGYLHAYSIATHANHSRKLIESYINLSGKSIKKYKGKNIGWIH